MIHKLFTAPMNLVIKVGEKVKEEADRELYDLDFIQQKLIRLQMMYELEEISEKVYKEKEEELLMRYEVAKARELEEWEAMTKKER
ncbi:gas vesicle protein GvpG [Bacillus gobiensis]|uniref:gas vesicle protein GvpG n=1 Tax=Bacillus gobiensis TaxID=1441095 RepID=UPI003D20DC3B